MRGYYYRRIFLCNRASNCALPKELSFRVCEVLSHRALSGEPNDLENQKQRDTEKLKSKNEKLQNALEAAKKATARLERAVREYERCQSTKCGMTERGRSSGSAGSSKTNESIEVRRPARESRKGSYSACKLSCIVKRMKCEISEIKVEYACV